MRNFLKFLFSGQDSSGGALGLKAVYDEDGNYVNADVAKMSEEELMIPADKARILHSKSLDEVKIKSRKRIFQLIHSAIKKGQTQLRLETYQIKSPEVLTYLDSMGYTVRDIIPPNANGRTSTPIGLEFLDEEGDDGEISSVPYHYYIISWNVTGTESSDTVTETV